MRFESVLSPTAQDQWLILYTPATPEDSDEVDRNRSGPTAAKKERETGEA